MVEPYLHSPVYLHGIVLNRLSTGTTLHFYTVIPQTFWRQIVGWLMNNEGGTMCSNLTYRPSILHDVIYPGLTQDVLPPLLNNILGALLIS
jgi:hypothetical protein